jgi:hypothetical protein
VPAQFGAAGAVVGTQGNFDGNVHLKDVALDRITALSTSPIACAHASAET